MSSVLVPVGEVLCSHGSTSHPYHLACQLYIVEDSTHKRNQQPGDFFWGDQGSINMRIFNCFYMHQLLIPYLLQVAI